MGALILPVYEYFKGTYGVNFHTVWQMINHVYIIYSIGIGIEWRGDGRGGEEVVIALLIELVINRDRLTLILLLVGCRSTSRHRCSCQKRWHGWSLSIGSSSGTSWISIWDISWRKPQRRSQWSCCLSWKGLRLHPCCQPCHLPWSSFSRILRSLWWLGPCLPLVGHSRSRTWSSCSCSCFLPSFSKLPFLYLYIDL